MGKKNSSKGGKGISRVKKANISRHKLVKKGKLKPNSKPKFVEGGQFQKKNLKKPQSHLSEAQIAERRKEYDDQKKQNVSFHEFYKFLFSRKNSSKFSHLV